MALFAPRLNPADVQLEYSSRIDAVGYPYLKQVAPDGKMISGEPEEYTYHLNVNVISYYRAEGHLRCPGLDGALAFLFQTENPLRPYWRLALGENEAQTSGPSPMMPLYYFQLRNIGKPARRKEIADVIKAAIEHEFLYQDHDGPFANRQSPEYVQSLLTSVGQAAGPDYQHTLEQHLREDPRKPILPQQYRYEIDGNVFQKEKLLKI